MSDTSAPLRFGVLGTGRITQKSGKLEDVDAHMLRNVLGDKDKQREVDR